MAVPMGLYDPFPYPQGHRTRVGTHQVSATRIIFPLFCRKRRHTDDYSAAPLWLFYIGIHPIILYYRERGGTNLMRTTFFLALSQVFIHRISQSVGYKLGHDTIKEKPSSSAGLMPTSSAGPALLVRRYSYFLAVAPVTHTTAKTYSRSMYNFQRYC